jgi:hypothetical protein
MGRLEELRHPRDERPHRRQRGRVRCAAVATCYSTEGRFIAGQEREATAVSGDRGEHQFSVEDRKKPR